MTTATRPESRSADSQGDGAAQPADVLVVFGITGDLAKVMTFRSLYRLEARGLLDCPIVGVAVSDWTDEDLREHAREAIVAGAEPLDQEVFDRFAARLSYVAGDFGDAATYERVAGAIKGAASFLKEQLGYVLLSMVTAVDWPDRIEVIYLVYSLERPNARSIRAPPPLLP